MKKLIISFLRDEDGQALSEYALLLALIAVVVIGAVSVFGNKIQELFTNLTGALSGTPSP